MVNKMITARESGSEKCVRKIQIHAKESYKKSLMLEGKWKEKSTRAKVSIGDLEGKTQPHLDGSTVHPESSKWSSSERIECPEGGSLLLSGSQATQKGP